MAKLFEYKGPWKGVDISMPGNMIDPASFVQCDNILPLFGELRSAPPANVGILPPCPLNSGAADWFTAVGSFLDANGTVHTYGVSTLYVYQLNSVNAWIQVSGAVNRWPGQKFPSTVAVFKDILYIVNGSATLNYWDGLTASVQQVGFIGGFYLMELDAHLLIAYTVEPLGAESTFQQRVRWSPSGLTNTFDPAVNIGAGYNDMLDVPDFITGMFAVGKYGYITRTNGITRLSPTSNPTQPFDFDHMWASEAGIGNVFPFATAVYGSTGFIVSTEQIYSLGAVNFEAIGGTARDAIYADIKLSNDNNNGYFVIGSIVPILFDGIVLMSYQLALPVFGGTFVWNYIIETRSWIRRVFSFNVTAKTGNIYVA